MGALVTLELEADSPQHDLPWIITFGPISDDDDWEPVVCGPYERPHALALAQHLVADEDLMAVVEPLLPATDIGQIRSAIELSQRNALEMADEEDDSLDTDLEADEGTYAEREEDHVIADEPTPEEIRAGFARLSARLTG
jgi:hypothetical protein